MGAVGGLEQNTATLTQGILCALAGLTLMAWALPKLIAQTEGNY
jgi:hypothetical protein